MAEIDGAPLRYRAVIEFFWYFEKKVGRACTDYIVKHDDADPPEWLQSIDVFLYRQRKAAERRALKKIGLW